VDDIRTGSGEMNSWIDFTILLSSLLRIDSSRTGTADHQNNGFSKKNRSFTHCKVPEAPCDSENYDSRKT
jgi:hypothetical protein